MSAAVLSSESVDATSSATRRKSGRVSKKPQPFIPVSSPAGSAKRKRNDETDGDVDIDEQSSEDEQEESSEGEPDKEELRDRRRKKKNKPALRKPAQKKPKTNGETVSLAIRPARSKSKKPRKAPIRKSALAGDVEGLYADVFAHGNNLEDVAAQWTASFQEHEANAVADIVNFVLRCAGCTITIDENDIADPDNCPNRLGEIQDEYQAQNVSEYPLLTKARGGAAFRNALHGFFTALVQTIAQNGLLYENTQLMENIQVWISTMASAPNRPFRHTSTVVSLAITSALARVASDLLENTAKKTRQSESEAKKARVNKARVSQANKEVEELGNRLNIVNDFITDWFDTVYVHRYRDVDPKIRVECVEALAEWIDTYPDKFFDGSHLRYLGWILSDLNPPTRLEVLKQLQKLFRDKDKLPGLKTFTERFRQRIVEMATQDADTTVRVAAIELLDILREAGFLEPDDIDVIGKLIFDADAKIRKAVVGFFAANIDFAYEIQIDEMGGQEALEDALPSAAGDDDYDNPRLDWLKLKSLVEQLLAYDANDEDLPAQVERLPPPGLELGLVAAGAESRISLAAQALYDAIPEIRSWEVLAGYLLYDHSQTTQNGATEDAEISLRQNCKLSEREETVLLDVLNTAVRLRLERLAEAKKDKKKTKAQREEDQVEQTETARKLSILIPQLLKKFGAIPEATSLCLRLQRLLNLDVFQELRQDASLIALLDDISKQFLTHNNELVLNEATEALLHTLANEEYKETAGAKVQELWDNHIGTFNTLRHNRDFSTRGNLPENVLSAISNIILKISGLARTSEPVILDKVPPLPTSSRKRSQKGGADPTLPIVTLQQILDRTISNAELDPETESAEDTLARRTMACMLPYFSWKVNNFAKHIESGTRIPDDELTLVAERLSACVRSLTKIMQFRKGADDTRIEAACLLLAIHTMFYSLKQIHEHGGRGAKKAGRPLADANDDWKTLCQGIDEPTTKLILQVLGSAEANLAKRTRKHLEEPEVDDDPIDPDDEPESSDDEEEIDERRAEEKMLRSLLAEQRLCELGGRIVKAVHVGALDGPDSGGKDVVRKRLERNKAKLGPNWKELVAHLDIRATAGKGGKKKSAGKENAKEKTVKSKEVVVEDDDDENQEIRGDEIEDEEMADDHIHDEAIGEEDDREHERSAEVESIVGD